MTKVLGYAAAAPGALLKPFEFERRNMGAHDVVLEITHCGICHSDLHAVDGEMPGMPFPMVPGHEIVGRITAVGEAVTKFSVGDGGAIGCFTDSCRLCEPCREGHEHMCVEGVTGTFGSVERGEQGLPTYGGYSRLYVANEDYVLRLPDTLDTASAAPLLCAGITTYSPLRKWKVGPGKRIGIVGIGGLGHIAIKLAVAMGAEVTAITTSASKAADARALGADHVLLSSDEAQMTAAQGQLDFVLNTVSAPHDLNGLVALLKPNSTLCLLGIGSGALPVLTGPIIFGQKCVAGSLIGGIAETQEMIDFCADHGIVADIELIRMDEVNEAYARLRRNDVKYRFVIDMSSLEPT
ncbi:hydroxyacid dehydrogenase [Sphingobium sp. 22B]|uniref:NAD(P)-dependent alcohol dehydrogenase n=1 Tax=unclassified Sphingobium TaxID=2611147 RepID=UPI0007818F43|nr:MULTISPECIES: NAD(P)-dependent alcohol dehydrogenase [unclassified Sphingobium]KXU33841.1 hydroxyacid dehydrogenase [Sphingobium sp. AM]KYC33785.1 hydroxyacid dehydrogenase [Sphingobium sp. 22B]OAP33521.1 hydroxyacid dehydrogenase [Sphingobium sp. 20006FA]